MTSPTAPGQRPPAGPPPAGPRPRRLRITLIAWFCVLLVVMAAAIGAVTEIALSRLLGAQLDQQVQATAFRLGGRGLNGTPPTGALPDGAPRPGSSTGVQPPEIAPAELLCSVGDDSRDRGARQPDDSIFAVITRGAITAAVRGQYPSCTVLTAEESAPLGAVPVDGAVSTVTLGDHGDYRVTAYSLGDVTLVSGLSTASVRATQRTLAVTTILVTIAVAVIGGGAVWWVVRRSLRPLDRVAGTARAVTQLPLGSGEVDLSVRVPVGLADGRSEVGQVGAALNQLLTHVEEALAARQRSERQVRRFVADASHELRTPLAAIRGYAELARRHPDDDAVVRQSLDRVDTVSIRMSRLVDDLLLLARLDEGRPPERTAVDLVELILGAVADARAAGPRHTWRVDLPDRPVIVIGDATRLGQVLANLLGNARVHIPPGATVTAGLAVTVAEAVVTVADDGEGIPVELQPEIFGRFVRGDGSRARSSGGTGLGLAIAATIVAAHGGTIGVTSRPGATVFTVRLPLGPVPGTAAGQPAGDDS